MATAACIKLIPAFSCARGRLFALKLARPYRHYFTLLVLLSLAFAIVLVRPTTARAFRLHVPCTGSHDCPRGAFCRHATNFRGQCITLPRTPFGITGRRLNEFPPESDPPDHIFGSMPILRCAKQKPCPPGFVSARIRVRQVRFVRSRGGAVRALFRAVLVDRRLLAFGHVRQGR